MDPQSPLAIALKSQARSNASARKELAATKTSDRECKFFVYVLLLQEGRIYVGATDNVYQRLYDHFNVTRSTAAFVRMYGPPTRVLEIVADAAPGDEDAITAKYIAMFGIDSVRGGKWHSIFSPPACDTRDVRASDRAFHSLSRAEIDDVMREIAAISAIEAKSNLPPPTASLEFMP
jgi:predicted GIY-YIG superfamily endonuclease